MPVTDRQRITIVVNPRSGRGRGLRLESLIARALADAGHRVTTVPIGDIASLDRDASGSPGPPEPPGPPDALIAVGGDGTVHAVLPFAMRLGSPVYHAPLGTENLFSREFGMTREPADVLRAVEARNTDAVDLAVCDGTPYAVMCGLGFDANVIEALHLVRNGAISHLSYLRPIWRELSNFRRVPVSVELDGEIIVEHAVGQLVVANSRQYALRADPALRASVRDGKTDVVFLPHTTRLGVLAWSARTRMRNHLASPRAVYASGERVRITAHEGGGAVQIDGEFTRKLDAGESMTITTAPSALRVLLPPAG